MSDTIIQVENLSKKYIIGHQPQERYVALRDVLTNGIKSLGQRLRPSKQQVPDPCHEEFWALKDVSFEVKRGDRIGIIGRNGAGKSTLLKILSRITEPTRGRIAIKGRVASLLEVGTGFHPELTGRENIYLNGAILGMSRAEIGRKFDEMVAFAEVEKFLDTPVKRYSSGMYVRLAFAVAAHLEPEILVVDEVLAVGDTQFQKKCLGKMEDVSRNEGRTILFVSHNLPAVQRLCQTGIYLERGEIKAHDELHKVLEAYQQESSINLDNLRNIEVENGKIRFVNWEIINHLDRGINLKHSCLSQSSCKIQFTLISKRKISDAIIGVAIWTLEGVLILAASSLDEQRVFLDLDYGTYYIEVNVRLPIRAGTYQLDISLNSQDLGQLDRWTAEPKLNILPCTNTNLPEHWHGLLNEEVRFEIRQKPILTMDTISKR